jgi:hypothetical protein
MRGNSLHPSLSSLAWPWDLGPLGLTTGQLSIPLLSVLPKCHSLQRMSFLLCFGCQETQLNLQVTNNNEEASCMA